MLLIPLFTFIVLPVVDQLTKDYYIEYKDPNYKEKRIQHEETNNWFFYYKSALYVFSGLEILNFTFSLYLVKEIQISTSIFWLISFNSGLITAISMTIAHELYHKVSKIDKFVGLLLLSLGSYSHFYLQHLFCHHKFVATEKDPNTAKYNETVYEFVPRSIIGGYIQSWRIEATRLKGSNFYNIFENRMILSTLVTIVVPIIIWKLFSFQSFIFFITQAIISIIFSELVNYIEHYGLERKFQPEKNKFENVNFQHSWDAPYRFSCYLSSNILLHADHHMNCLKEYEKLTAIEGSPIMPYTYMTMMILSLYPKLYFSIVNPHLDEYKKNFEKKCK
eukprot:gene3898-7111_t